LAHRAPREACLKAVDGAEAGLTIIDPSLLRRHFRQWTLASVR